MIIYSRDAHPRGRGMRHISPNMLHDNNIETAVAVLQAACGNASSAAGWWKDKEGKPVTDNPYCFSNKLMLITSELAEAMEGDRKSLMDTHLVHRPMREVELADALIRLCDLAAMYNLDLAGAVVEKMRYNAKRADHKPEARAQANGKAY